jgi:hypothetical protein
LQFLVIGIKCAASANTKTRFPPTAGKRVFQEEAIRVEFLHSRLALTAILFALALGVWGTWNFLRRQGVTSSYWGALVIGEILMLVQGVIGVFLVFTAALPRDLLHFLYGVLVALSWPAVYIYTNGRTERNEAGIYALVSFFVFGLALRAITTGGG